MSSLQLNSNQHNPFVDYSAPLPPYSLQFLDYNLRRSSSQFLRSSTSTLTYTMASNEAVSNSAPALYESGLTIPSDSENYSANHDSSSTSSDSPLILYKPSTTLWSVLRGAAINLFLPFVNGLMLGFGELFAHEAAFRLGWSGTKIFPTYRRSRPVAAGLGL
ncbi:outer membrane protein TOM13-domain-containing protein [Aspergillus fruticulosus]